MKILTVALCFVSFYLPASALAQDSGTVEVRGSVGAAAFLDDDEDKAIAYGGAVRYYLTSRLSVEPDFYYLRGRDQGIGEGKVRDYEFNVNLAYDFLKADKVTPYVFGGGGVQFHRNEFRTPAQTFEIRETRESFGGGAGMKIFLTERLFVAPEIRLGWETLVRAVVSVGYRL